jgi:hypothetical protein
LAAEEAGDLRAEGRGDWELSPAPFLDVTFACPKAYYRLLTAR